MISIIIPVYNEEKTISEVIDILVSKEEVAELILIDDGSSDYCFSFF